MPERYIFMKNILFRFLIIALEAQNEREKLSESLKKKNGLLDLPETQKSVHVYFNKYNTAKTSHLCRAVA